MGESLNTGTLLAVHLALSQEIQTLFSPQRTLSHSALEPRVNNCKGDFVNWLLKMSPVFLADSHISLADRNLTDFYSQMLCGYLLPVMLLWAGKSVTGLDPTLFRGSVCS